MPVRDVVVPAAKEGPPGKLPAVYPPPPPSSSSTSGADASAGGGGGPTVDPPFEYSEHTDFKGQCFPNFILQRTVCCIVLILDRRGEIGCADQVTWHPLLHLGKSSIRLHQRGEQQFKLQRLQDGWRSRPWLQTDASGNGTPGLHGVTDSVDSLNHSTQNFRATWARQAIQGHTCGTGRRSVL